MAVPDLITLSIYVIGSKKLAGSLRNQEGDYPDIAGKERKPHRSRCNFGIGLHDSCIENPP